MRLERQSFLKGKTVSVVAVPFQFRWAVMRAFFRLDPLESS